MIKIKKILKSFVLTETYEKLPKQGFSWVNPINVGSK